jgi:hypothetical protein
MFLLCKWARSGVALADRGGSAGVGMVRDLAGHPSQGYMLVHHLLLSLYSPSSSNTEVDILLGIGNTRTSEPCSASCSALPCCCSGAMLS